MLMMSFLPRNVATDVGRPSTAEERARVGNASPTLKPRGSGALRSQIGLAFDWSGTPAARTTTETTEENNHVMLYRMGGPPRFPSKISSPNTIRRNEQSTQDHLVPYRLDHWAEAHQSTRPTRLGRNAHDGQIVQDTPRANRYDRRLEIHTTRTSIAIAAGQREAQVSE